MKVFYRIKNTPDKQIIPYNYNIANALEGALQLGLECIPYYSVSEIFDKYNRGDIVLDGIQQVHYCLSKFDISPGSFDYPDILKPYLGRKIWLDNINSIASNEEKWSAGNFVKPIKEKAFTGKIISSIQDLIGCGSCYENYDVLVSEPLDVVYECRGFVYYDELKDLRPYKGDYKYMKYMNTDVIAQAMEDWKKWDNRPNACSLDWGVVRTAGQVKSTFTPSYCGNKAYNEAQTFYHDGIIYKTVLIEGNLPYALGCYGYYSIDYIKLISAYISQISGVKDELYFIV